MTCRNTRKSKIDVAIPDDDDPPLAGPSFVNDDELSQLREMFPSKPIDCLHDSLAVHGSVTKAALSLSGAEVDVDDSDLDQSAFDTAPESLQAIIEELKKQLSDEKEEVKVEENDLLNDALTITRTATSILKRNLELCLKINLQQTLGVC